MKKRTQKSTAKAAKPVELAPRRRGQGDAAATVPKSYTLPFPVVLELRQAVKDYGSQGRALQVAAELASRLTKLPSVEEPDPDVLVRMTYKLLPRTIEQIDELARNQYGTTGKAIAACVKTLKIKKLD